LWTGVIIVAYYVVQKPSLIGAIAGLADTLWTFLVAVILLFNSYGLGKRILTLFKFETQDLVDHLLLSVGLGLGSLGLLGLFISVIQLANTKILTVVQIILILVFLFRNDLKNLRTELSSLVQSLNLSFSQYNIFSKLSLFLLLTFSFLLTLVPPFEAFDALLYHLALPASILRSGGLQAFNNPPAWFPTLTENVYLWALGMGSERATQIIHFVWGLIAVLLLWHWAAKAWNIETARKALLLLASMPSLTMLASWAYADMSLVYYAVAVLYTLTSYRLSKNMSLLNIMAILAGMAMGVKYQSFVVPLTCGLILLFQRPVSKSWSDAFRFSIITLLVALPWYLRNLVIMGNPFYPFVFGGRYWDHFLAGWWTNAGTGIGWNAIQILLLPLNVTLGHRDATFYDGRIGPLFLLFLPLTIWIFLRSRSDSLHKRLSLVSIGSFTAISFIVWALGVINTSALWQSRYLFPAVMAFAIPTALAWDSISEVDRSRLRVSFLVNALIGLTISLTVIDHATFVLQRNPLAVAFGAQSRERYIERVNPSYAALMNAINELPLDARVYSLFEPRSYGLPRFVQPDPINSNFAHDIYLFRTPEVIIQNWKSQQYTHIIVYERGRNFIEESDSNRFTATMQATLNTTLEQLKLMAQTPDKIYSIYQIP
jgi:hypothetical protein